MSYESISYDAHGTDGTDYAKMSAIYRVNGSRIVLIPATTPESDISSAIWAAMQSDE